jgi:hypothetical protein
MGLVISLVRGRNYPLAHCDVCKQKIESTGDGLALYRPEGGGVKLVHRGACDAAQKLLSNTHLNWMALGEYIYLLSHNLKLDVNAEEAHLQLWERL